MIILFGGIKGGSGKTTAAVNTAAMAAADGGDVLLVDADPQGSATTWASLRPEDQPRITCVSKTGDRVHRDIDQLAPRFNVTVIDAGGRDSKEFRSALVICNKLYTPLQPSHADAWTLEALSDLVDQAKLLNRRLESHVYVSRASTHPSIPETEEAESLAGQYEAFEASGVTIRERVSVRRSFGLGLSVAEYGEDQKAIKEFENLYRHAINKRARTPYQEDAANA